MALYQRVVSDQPITIAVTNCKMRAFLFLTVFILLALHVAGGGRDEVTAQELTPLDLSQCSRLCQCHDTWVDCSHRGLSHVPRDLPKDADKM